MKKIIYMAMSMNGKIAKANDDTDFVTTTEWKSFLSMINKSGNIIVGRRTYEIIMENNEFRDNKIKMIIVSKNKTKLYSKNHIIVNSPKNALKILGKSTTALIAGGSKLNTSFIKQNLVDEIYIDIEPTIIGKGINFFDNVEFTKKLKLLNIKKLSSDEIQLHYKVLK